MQQQLLSYMNELADHPVFTNDYFKLLKETKLTPTLFAIHRANFFYRTMATVIGIAHICGHAAKEHDQDTLILFSYILNEECGDGKKSHCHELLMENSHNLYGQFEFDLPALKVRDLEGRRDGTRNDKAFALVIEETKDYRSKVNQLLGMNYRTMLGVAYALETHASIMLTHFRDAFGASRHNLDQKRNTHDVEVYFNCHLDSGVEDRHAADAQQCVLNNCSSEADLADIIYGIDQTLKIQHHMWNGMYRHAAQLAN
ncbi:iron-containing redox enzyme family protein [Undibacterium sp. RTI2.2]|nr:iron-containing redox enzyme family protein [Undibacterium sp. RTI2.2]